jgi:hypothetical protein
MDGSEIDAVRALLNSKPRPVGRVQRRERKLGDDGMPASIGGLAAQAGEVTMLLTKVLASSSGFTIGAFLFFRYSQFLANFVYSWIQPRLASELLWYEIALFLGGIGLAEVFPLNRTATASLD